MNKKIEEEVLATTKYLTKKFGLDESDINRLKNILIRIAQKIFGEQFNSVENTDDIDVVLKYGGWLQPEIGSYFSEIPNNKVFELFENNDIDDLMALEYFFNDLDFDFFYTYEELSNIIKPFIRYLSNNRNAIISTGFPLTSFEQSYWFYNNLSRLYPLKQPYAILRKEKNKEGNFLLEYHWEKRPENLFNSSNLKKSDFLNATYNSRYSFSAIDLIEDKRPILFELKIEILNILFDALLDKNCLGLWKKCFRCMDDKLESEDFKSFIQIGEINYFFPDIYSEKKHENLFKKYNMSSSDYFFKQGGLTQIIELIFQVEKELRLGHINKIKNKLLTLSKNEIISTYYELLLNVDISELFTIGAEFREYQKEENKYRIFFKERLTNVLKKSFKTSLSDKPNRHDSIELLINSLMNKINSKIDFTESRNTSKTNTNNIIPIKLPPNTKWGQIVMQFIDNENIKITAPDNFKYTSNYVEMGFKDKRRLCPNTQWRFLQFLSLRKGCLSWKSLVEERNAIKKEDIEKLINQAKKRKQFLKDKLIEYFQINEDPFHDYRKINAYEVKFHLFPQEHLQEIL